MINSSAVPPGHAGRKPASSGLLAARRQVVDGRPAPAMTWWGPSMGQSFRRPASLAPAPSASRVEPARGFDQAGAHRRVQRRQRMARGVAGDDAALAHQRLAGQQAALAVLVIDQRQPALIARDRLLAAPGLVVVNDRAQAVRIGAARHAAGRPGVEIGQQGDRLLAVPRPLDRRAAERDQLAQLGGGGGQFDLEIGDLGDLAGHAGEQGGRQRRAADRGVLEHDRNIDRIRNGAEEIDDRPLRQRRDSCSLGQLPRLWIGARLHYYPFGRSHNSSLGGQHLITGHLRPGNGHSFSFQSEKGNAVALIYIRLQAEQPRCRQWRAVTDGIHGIVGYNQMRQMLECRLDRLDDARSPLSSPVSLPGYIGVLEHGAA